MELDSSSLDLEQLGRYFQLLASMSRSASQFEGKSREQNAILRIGIEIEKWILRTCPHEKGNSIEREEAVRNKVENLIGIKPASIADVLEASTYYLQMILDSETDPENLIERLGLVHQKLEGIILPPGQEMPDGSSESTIIRKPIIPRFQYLIAGLQERGIHTDDLIVTTGTLGNTQLRTESYRLIEIPSLQKEVLVCNQRGEATFISMIHRGTSAYTSHTKEELEQMPGIQKLRCGNLIKWKSDILASLFSAGNFSASTEVGYLLETRNEANKITTPEEWVKMNAKTKRNFRIFGTRLNIVAKKCGIVGLPSESHIVHLRFGAMLFGRDASHISTDLDVLESDEKRMMELGDDPEKWKLAIQSRKTAKEWLAMDSQERRAFRLAGLGLRALALRMNADLDAHREEEDHLRLGLVIYGASGTEISSALEVFERNKKAQEELGTDAERWAAVIRKKITSSEWVTMAQNRENCRDFECNGLKIIAIARIFGITRSSLPEISVILDLGSRIFGESDLAIMEARNSLEEITRERTVALKNPEIIINALKSELTPREWIAMNQKQRAKFKIMGLGFGKIATILGVDADSWGSREAFLKLGIIIFGSDPEIQNALANPGNNTAANYEPANGLDEFIIKIQAQCSPEKWVNWHDKKNHDLKFEGFGLARIAKMLNIEGDPYCSKLVRLKMAEKIYGSDNVTVQYAFAIEQERLSSQNKTTEEAPGVEPESNN